MATMALKSQLSRKTTVNRLDLLAKLKENREEHIKQYELAIAGYKEEAIKNLNEAVKRAKKRIQKKHKELKSLLENFDPKLDEYGDYLTLTSGESIQLDKPRLYKDAYDKAIAMFEWEVNETVDLDTAEFVCFVQNQWDWTADFSTVTTKYLGASR